MTHYIEMVLYQHLLESYLSEQAARMVAMQSATDNAKEMIEKARWTPKTTPPPRDILSERMKEVSEEEERKEAALQDPPQETKQEDGSAS